MLLQPANAIDMVLWYDLRHLLGTPAMKAVKSVAFAALLASTGAGCTARMNARDSVEQSLAIYRYCISQHAEDPLSCDSARRIYEDDLRAYEAGSQGQP